MSDTNKASVPVPVPEKKAIVFEEVPVGSPPNPSGSHPSFPLVDGLCPDSPCPQASVLGTWQPQTPAGRGPS